MSGSVRSLFWATRIESESATSRCWAPSCRLRSSRRRSAVPASTIRARDDRSSSTRARSCASRRSFSIARPAAVATLATSSGSSQRTRSWTIAPTRLPSWSTEVQERAGSAGSGRRGGAAERVDPGLLVVEPVEDPQRAVAERAREQGPQPAAGPRVAHPLQQLRHRAAADHPRADQAVEERVRRDGERQLCERVGDAVDGVRAADRLAGQRRRQQREQDDARPQDRRQRAALRRRRALPALQQDVEHVADEHDGQHRRDRVEDDLERLVVGDQDRRGRAAVAVLVDPGRRRAASAPGR